jgi:hypothetical protein
MVKAQPPAAFLSKRDNLGFPVFFTRPDATEFRLVNATVLCGFQFPFYVTRELLHNEANLKVRYLILNFFACSGEIVKIYQSITGEVALSFG